MGLARVSGARFRRLVSDVVLTLRPLVSLVRGELLRRLRVLVCRIRGNCPCSLGVRVPLVALLPLGILRLLPPLGLGLIGSSCHTPQYSGHADRIPTIRTYR